MLKIAVCDDEIYFVNKFSDLLVKNLTLDIKKLDTFTNPAALLKSKEIYDLLFLDINMPKISGIEIARNYNMRETNIVFVTGKESLVFDAYNSTNSFGFVRKSRLHEDLQSVIYRYNQSFQSDECLILKSGSQIVRVRCSDILYIEKIINNIVVHTTKGDFSERNTIANVEKTLDSCGFVRTHIGYLVNMEHIYLIEKNDVILSNAEKVPVSRHNAKNVKYKFLRKKGALYGRYG